MFLSIFLCWTWISQIDLPNMGIYHQKMHEMHCFMFFSKFWHMFSVLWDLQMHEICFLLAQHVISIIENCYFCFKWQNMLQHFFVSNVLFHFLVLNMDDMDVSKSTCQIWPFISKKNAKHVSFSCKCLQFLQEKHVLCCECQYIFYGHWPCCIQMDSIDSFKFLMRIILVSYFGGLCFNRPFVFPSFRTGDGDILAQVSQDGDRQWQAQF
jgi:hypothetical protein